MSYRTVDEFANFSFKDAHISSMERKNGHFVAVLDAVKILSSNSCNRDIRDMGTNELELKLQDGVITEFILEGCKIYNADGVLMEQKDDIAIEPEKYDEVLKTITDSYIYDITKEDDIYTILIDGEDDSYTIRVKAVHDTEQWERFMSPSV